MAPAGREQLLPAARRFAVLLVAAVVVVGGVAALTGLALGADALQSAASGLYIVGSFLIVLGVFNGLRGPVRPRGDDDEREAVGGLFGVGIFSGGIRTATADERADARGTTWLFLTLGFALVIVGAAVDPRASVL